MAEVEIAIGKSKYKIQCQESEKEKLVATAAKLNERVNRLSFSFRNLDEKTLLVITALTLEEEVQDSENKDSVTEFAEQISEQDIYDAVSENMENISDYVEKLIKKIRDY